MKKYLFLLILIVSASVLAFAEDDADLEGTEKLMNSAGQGKLVDLHTSRAISRIQSLEQRLDQLERDHRFQNEQIRNLERSVSDLRRRS